MILFLSGYMYEREGVYVCVHARMLTCILLVVDMKSHRIRITKLEHPATQGYSSPLGGVLTLVGVTIKAPITNKIPLA